MSKRSAQSSRSVRAQSRTANDAHQPRTACDATETHIVSLLPPAETELGRYTPETNGLADLGRHVLRTAHQRLADAMADGPDFRGCWEGRA